MIPGPYPYTYSYCRPCGRFVPVHRSDGRSGHEARCYCTRCYSRTYHLDDASAAVSAASAAATVGAAAMFLPLRPLPPRRHRHRHHHHAGRRRPPRRCVTRRGYTRRVDIWV